MSMARRTAIRFDGRPEGGRAGGSTARRSFVLRPFLRTPAAPQGAGRRAALSVCSESAAASVHGVLAANAAGGPPFLFATEAPASARSLAGLTWHG